MYEQSISSEQRYTKQVNFEAFTVGNNGGFKLSKPGVWIAKPFAHNPIWSRLGKPFDLEHFLYPAIPVDIGKVSLTTPVDRIRVLRTPIKFSGDEHLYIPEELRFAAPLIEHVLETESSVNSHYLESFAHITVEHTYVEEGKAQRVPGWHVDGFQGTRLKAHAAEHSYLWCDTQPAEFCIQPFFIDHLDPGRHSVFAEFEKQAQNVNVFRGLPGHIYLIDPYLVHRSTIMKNEGWRTFVRITFSDIELQDPMNTINTFIPLAQEYEPRMDHRDRLYNYEAEVNYYNYGICKT